MKTPVTRYITNDKKLHDTEDQAESYIIDQVCSITESIINREIGTNKDLTFHDMQLKKRIILSLVGDISKIKVLQEMLNFWMKEDEE